jgi:CrcB protein
MLKLVLIASGGAVGTLLRYGVNVGVRHWDGALPIATLSVNVVGCFLIGVIATLFPGPEALRDELRLALLVGLLGGFTTFSTFGLETLSMINRQQIGTAAAYVLASNILGLAAVWLGWRIAAKALV